MWAMKVNHGSQTLLFVHLISKDVVSTHPIKVYTLMNYTHIFIKCITLNTNKILKCFQITEY